MSAALRKAQRAYETGLARAEQLREARDEQIRADLAVKVPHKEIMGETGLSRGRVDQIRRGVR